MIERKRMGVKNQLARRREVWREIGVENESCVCCGKAGRGQHTASTRGSHYSYTTPKPVCAGLPTSSDLRTHSTKRNTKHAQTESDVSKYIEVAGKRKKTKCGAWREQLEARIDRTLFVCHTNKWIHSDSASRPCEATRSSLSVSCQVRANLTPATEKDSDQNSHEFKPQFPSISSIVVWEATVGRKPVSPRSKVARGAADKGLA